jgi:transposase-like protein
MKRQYESSSRIQWERGRGGRGAARANAIDRRR